MIFEPTKRTDKQIPTNACITKKLFVWANKEGQPTRGVSWPLWGSDKPYTSLMRPHREHDGFAYKCHVGKEVMSFVPHHYGMASRLGGS